MRTQTCRMDQINLKDLIEKTLYVLRRKCGDFFQPYLYFVPVFLPPLGVYRNITLRRRALVPRAGRYNRRVGSLRRSKGPHSSTVSGPLWNSGTAA